MRNETRGRVVMRVSTIALLAVFVGVGFRPLHASFGSTVHTRGQRGALQVLASPDAATHSEGDPRPIAASTRYLNDTASDLTACASEPRGVPSFVRVAVPVRHLKLPPPSHSDASASA